MCGEELFKCLCVMLLLGLTVEARSAMGPNAINVTAHRGAQLSAKPFDEWDPDFCEDKDEGETFPHPETCEMFFMCFEGELLELDCGDGLLWDFIGEFCGLPEDVICYEEDGPIDPDDECPPPGSSEIRFLPSENCEEYYICIGGQPVRLSCRPGQHWNIEEEFCDDPETAGCDVDPSPEPLPECPRGATIQLPHPHNCNWFIHCNNGNRSIQQCQHLFHFDVNSRRCMFKTQATCIKDRRN